jgi:hypothetical protein
MADICPVGMRFGASSPPSVDQDGDIDQLVLWDPCNTGRSCLAEKKVLGKLSAGAQLVNL